MYRRKLCFSKKLDTGDHRQKKMGYNAAQELYRRVQANMTKSDDEE